MAEDRSKQSLNLYGKDGAKISTGTLGAKTVAVTGLAASTAVAAGDYQVAWTDGTNESAKVDVPAFSVPVPVVAVTGVTLDATTGTGTVGGTQQLKATVDPANATNQKLTFSSSDDTLLTVDANGLVTFVAAGTADATVTTEDGSFTAKCTFTIAAAA